MFDPKSRYAKIEEATLLVPKGEEAPEPVRYKRRRFIPNNEGSILLTTLIAREGDRIDNVAARHLGDPSRYYHLCDENGVMTPSDLVAAPGRAIRVAMPKP